MKSPIERFIEWYKSLPISHRQDIAALVSSYCPGFGSVDITADLDVLPDLFVEAVRSYQDGSFREIGATLSLRSFIQLIFIDKRSDRNGWKDTEESLASLAKEKGSETFTRMANEVPFKAEQWIASCEKWNKLVADHISDQKLRLFLP